MERVQPDTRATELIAVPTGGCGLSSWSWTTPTGNDSVLTKIITNGTVSLFLNGNQHSGNFKPQQFPSSV